MPVKNIVRGQKVSSEKVIRSKELRREMTPAEKVLWERLRRNGLSGLHFRRQQIIAGLLVDFYCHAAALVIELDGEIHESQAETDAARDRSLCEKGLRILRFKNHEILTDLETVLAKIQAACQYPPSAPPFPSGKGGRGG